MSIGKSQERSFGESASPVKSRYALSSADCLDTLASCLSRKEALSSLSISASPFCEKTSQYKEAGIIDGSGSSPVDLAYTFSLERMQRRAFREDNTLKAGKSSISTISQSMRFRLTHMASKLRRFSHRLKSKFREDWTTHAARKSNTFGFKRVASTIGASVSMIEKDDTVVSMPLLSVNNERSHAGAFGSPLLPSINAEFQVKQILLVVSGDLIKLFSALLSISVEAGDTNYETFATHIVRVICLKKRQFFGLAERWEHLNLCSRLNDDVLQHVLWSCMLMAVNKVNAYKGDVHERVSGERINRVEELDNSPDDSPVVKAAIIVPQQTLDMTLIDIRTEKVRAGDESLADTSKNEMMVCRLKEELEVFEKVTSNSSDISEDDHGHSQEEMEQLSFYPNYVEPNPWADDIYDYASITELLMADNPNQAHQMSLPDPKLDVIELHLEEEQLTESPTIFSKKPCLYSSPLDSPASFITSFASMDNSQLYETDWKEPESYKFSSPSNPSTRLSIGNSDHNEREWGRQTQDSDGCKTSKFREQQEVSESDEEVAYLSTEVLSSKLSLSEKNPLIREELPKTEKMLPERCPLRFQRPLELTPVDTELAPLTRKMRIPGRKIRSIVKQYEPLSSNE